MPLFDQDAFDNSRYDAKDDIKDKELAVDMASDSAPPTTQNEAAPAGVSKVEGAQKIWTKSESAYIPRKSGLDSDLEVRSCERG